ncbi:MAG: mucoidy inhibitor MuiA family protein, partial [Phycisphaerales bacterium]
MRVTGLPAGVDPAQVQARVRAAAGSSGEAPRLLAVEYEEAPGIDFAGSPEGVELATKLKDAKRRQAEAAQDRAQLEQRAARIDQVGVRAAANATAEGGTATADPARALEQVGWVRSQRAKLLDESRALAERTDAIGREVAALEAAVAQRGRADRTQRTSVVRLAAPSACALELDLTYVVDRAGWAPAYAIRAAADRSGTSVEYDAVLAQHSGEDWTDARITLSTARPDASAAPGDVVPVYVDVAPPMVAGIAGGYGKVGSVSGKDNRMRRPGKPRGPGGGGGSSGDPDTAGVPADDAGRADALEEMAGGASVAESGIAATFELPRRVSVPSDAARTQRTRIATLEPSVAFVHVAHPLMTEEVFVRGDLVNDSGYQLLPGTAQVFFGGDLVGDAAVPAVGPPAPLPRVVGGRPPGGARGRGGGGGPR